MTSSDARKILKLQEEEKRRTEIVKAANNNMKKFTKGHKPPRDHMKQFQKHRNR